MKIDWVSLDNVLLLNPRLPAEASSRFEAAWSALVEPAFSGVVGLATSGSSGDSFGRLIVISKSSLLMAAIGANAHLHSTRNDVWMKTLPDFHVGGLSIGARSHLSGAAVVQSRLEKWDPVVFYNELTESKASLLSLVPSQLFDLVQRKLKAPPMLRAVVIGGARLERELHRQALALGWPALPSYGMTECGSQVATAPVGTIGSLIAAASADAVRLRPLSHVEIRIGEDDRIELRSAALLSAQILFDGENQTPRLVDPKADGWFRTEDRGRLEEDGSLTVLGRTSDFVKIGGEGVVVSRLESQLEELKLKQSFAFDACVLAAPDPRLGASIVLITDASPEAVKPLVDAFNQIVAPFERVRAVHSLERIPRSALGKLLRGEALELIGLKSLANN